MLKLILAAIILILAIVGGLAVALNHFFGWKGLIAFPFILIALVWGGKVVIGKMIKHFALGLFSMKSSVLRGATMTVHSITAVAGPPSELEASGEESNDTDASDESETDAEDDQTEQAEELDEPEPPKHYFDVDVTITPKNTGSDRVWEPGELILTTEKLSSLADLEEGNKELGTAGAVRVWDGSQFGPDDPGKYPGEQRLKVTFEVKPGTSKAWLHYYNEAIGTLELPPWEPCD